MRFGTSFTFSNWFLKTHFPQWFEKASFMRCWVSYTRFVSELPFRGSCRGWIIICEVFCWLSVGFVLFLFFLHRCLTLLWICLFLSHRFIFTGLLLRSASYILLNVFLLYDFFFSFLAVVNGSVSPSFPLPLAVYHWHIESYLL